jgi:hypothetical protein
MLKYVRLADLISVEADRLAAVRINCSGATSNPFVIC